jgi:tRNA-specific 2-thiouridylase
MASMKNEKIVVGLSGGVDSAVTAMLLRDQGHEVVGVHMLTLEEDLPGCTSAEARQDALRVAKFLNIPFRVIDLRQEYKTQVIDRMLNDYKKGFTPNPDIWCNEFIKFDLLLKNIKETFGINKIATGHYARINAYEGVSKQGYQLRVAIDEGRDQSYFLYRVPPSQLANIMLPLGEMKKPIVREIARNAGLPVAEKPDSAGVCFIGDVRLKDFLKNSIDLVSGEVMSVDGQIIGRHEGLPLYTLGQRHGFSRQQTSDTPLFVIEKRLDANQLVIGPAEKLLTNKIKLGDFHQTNIGHGLTDDTDIQVRTRHLGELINCRAKNIGGGELVCETEKEILRVSPGQHCVFYIGEVVVGGGISLG